MFDVTGQSKNIYLGVYIRDRLGPGIPANILIDTGAEGTFVHPGFAINHLSFDGEVQGMDYVCRSDLMIEQGRDVMRVDDIRFLIRPTMNLNLFIAQLETETGVIPVQIDAIVGMDVLKKFDFLRFHKKVEDEMRTFFSLWPAGGFVEVYGSTLH